jgi:ubiquinone/menaquinone biosynthesis C-methylase UbiE
MRDCKRKSFLVFRTGLNFKEAVMIHAKNAFKKNSTLALMLVLSAVALILYAHGVLWWYAPLALVGILLAHLAFAGAVLFVVTKGRRSHGGGMRSEEGTDQSPEAQSLLLHKPEQFDFLARICTLGRETKLREWTLNLGELQMGNAVLDVGCGTGTLLLTAAERIGRSGSLYGIEPSQEMAAYARKKAETKGVPVEIVERSADNLPFPPTSFDVIYSTLVFHHLPGSMQARAIREMRRVLRPGGRVVIVDWQKPTSFAKALLSPMFLVYLLHSFRPSGSRLDATGIAQLMRELGFKDIGRSSFGPGGAVGAVIGRLGWNKV